MTPLYLHGIHDADGAHLMDGLPGWVVISEAIGRDPNDRSGRDYNDLARRGLGVIVRLNHAHNGRDGTIPAPHHYRDFAQRCANFVAGSTGITAVIIGNEPNHEAEWVNGQKIDPVDYANCFGECRHAIRASQPQLPVLVAAVAPWNNASGDWLAYLKIVINKLWSGCDGFALHAYTHGADPRLVTSTEIQHGWFWHFRTYRQQLAAIADVIGTRARQMLFVITETNQGDDPWLDADNGWVQAAYAEIDAWNAANPDLLVRGLCLYRSNRDDKWSFADKDGVKRDFRKAVERGYKVPPFALAQPPQKDAQKYSHQVTLPSIKGDAAMPPALPPRDIDPRAAARGTTVQTPRVEPGQQFWRVKRLFTPDEAESDRLGPDRHVLANVLVEGQRQTGVPLLVAWGTSPDQTATIHTKHNPNFAFSADHALTPGEWTIEVADGRQSERVVGIKMGMQTPQGWNPGAHTSTLVDFELTTMPAAQPQPLAYVVAPNGANLRQSPDVRAGNIITVVAYGEPVRVVEYETAGNGTRWALVQYQSYGGWMAADLLRATRPAPQPAQPQPTPPAPPVEQPKPTPTPAATRLIWPTNARRSQRWGENPAYYSRVLGIPYHNGIDHAAPEGTAVVAMADGEVMFVGDDPGYGIYVRVYHAALGIHSFVAHLSRVTVKVGQMVKQGEVIAFSGATGHTAATIHADGTADTSRPAPHTHTEIRLGGRDAYAEGTFGHSNGRIDPEVAMYLINTIRGGRAAAQPSNDLRAIVRAAALEFGLDPALFHALVQRESSYRPDVVSRAGAVGLAQVMPGTFAEHGPSIGATNIYNPTDNARTGAKYLRLLIDYYRGDLRKALTAYNWGPGNVDSGRTPPAETVQYVNEILEAVGA